MDYPEVWWEDIQRALSISATRCSTLGCRVLPAPFATGMSATATTPKNTPGSARRRPSAKQ